MNTIREFDNHVATLIQNTDRYFIIDWRNKNGSSNYYVNYIVDKLRGSLIISGDLGDAIATWYHTNSPTDIKQYVKDTNYFMSKLCCSSDLYTYSTESILNDLKDDIEPDTLADYIAANSDIYDSEEIFWKQIEYYIDSESSFDDKYFRPCPELHDILLDLVDESWIPTIGRKINPRIELWTTGYRMALDQLEIDNLDL